jgi:prevent-host-death family protein
MMKKRSGPAARPVGEVKARFSECIRAAETGATTIVTRHGRPVACIAPYVDSAALLASEVREPGGAYESHPETRFDSIESRRAALRRLLEEEIRPRVPARLRGKGVSKEEKERILGYREDGV